MNIIVNNKLLRVFFLGSLFILIVFLFFVSRKDIKKRVNTNPIETNVRLPEYIKGNFPIQFFETIFKDVSLPKTLPTYSFFLKNKSEKDFELLAQNLGFNEKPNIAKDVIEGNKLIWANQKASLWVTPSKSYINYYQNGFIKKINSPNISEQDLQKRALDFLVQKIGLGPDEIIQTSTVYLKAQENPLEGLLKTTRESAELYHFNYTYKTVNLPIYTKIPIFQIIYVQMTATGTVNQSEIYLLEGFKPSIDQYLIKNDQDIKNNLSQSKIMEVENEYLSLTDLSASEIDNVNIGELSVGYFFDDNIIEYNLRPIFRLSGEIKIKTRESSYGTLYLPAFK